MTMIPPVEVRQVRPCGECVFYLGSGIGSNGEWTTICNLDKFVDSLGYSNRDDKPCPENFREEEMQAFIDQHNAWEQS